MLRSAHHRGVVSWKRRAVDCLLLCVSAGLVLAGCGDGVVHHVSAGSLPLVSGLHRDASIEEKDTSDGGLGQRLYARFDLVVSDTQNGVGAKVAEEAFLQSRGWRRDRSVPAAKRHFRLAGSAHCDVA